jgi:type I restriction enzyme S subunit
MELKIDKDNWELIKLGDVFTKKEENDKENAKNRFDRFLKVEHMDAESLHIKRWSSQENGDELNPYFYKIFRKGQVLFPTRNPHLRRTVLASFDGICGEKTLTLEPNQEFIHPEFIPFLFHSESFYAHTTAAIIGSTNPHVRWRDVANYEFLLPPKEEQAKLAELLWAMDEVIEREKEVLERLQTISKSIAINHLKDIKQNGILKLGEVCRPRQWKTIPIKDLSDEGFLVYGGNGLIGRYGEYNHEKPVIAVACRGEYCGSIHLTEPKSYITGNSMCLDNLNTSILNQKYLFYYLFYSNLDSIISGSAQPQIIKEDIERYKVRITDIKSQIDLVAKMDKAWNNIIEINSKISCSQALLKSLINQVF